MPAGTGALSSHRIRSLCGLTAFEPPIRIHMKLVLRLIGEAVGSADLLILCAALRCAGFSSGWNGHATAGPHPTGRLSLLDA